MTKIFHSFLVFGLLMAPSAMAQEFKLRDPVYTLSTTLDTVSKLLEDPTDALVAQHVTRLTTEAKARFEWRDDVGRKLMIDPFLRKYHYSSVEDELQFGVFAEFRHPVSQEDKSELRWRGGIEHAQDVFTRTTLQALINTRHSKSHSSQAMLRYRYRDQDDAQTFSGFDQHEMYASFQQTHVPDVGDIKRINGVIYGDFRQAAAPQFDYAELGARMTIRFEPRDGWDLTAKASGFIREYRSDFSGAGSARRDERFKVGLESKYDLGGRQTLSGAFGWETNRSNLAGRTFSGPVVRIDYTIKFN